MRTWVMLLLEIKGGALWFQAFKETQWECSGASFVFCLFWELLLPCAPCCPAEFLEEGRFIYQELRGHGYSVPIIFRGGLNSTGPEMYGPAKSSLIILAIGSNWRTFSSIPTPGRFNSAAYLPASSIPAPYRVTKLWVRLGMAHLEAFIGRRGGINRNWL